MVLNIAKRIYRYSKLLLNVFNLFTKSFFKFIVLNLFKIINKKVIFKTLPAFNQRTIISGEGRVKIGKKCSFGYKLGGFYRGGSIELQSRYKVALITIGDNVATNNNIFICAANHIEIGDNTLIGQNVTIMDFEAHGKDPDSRRKEGEIGTIMIGNNVWIGNNVIILKNTIIGDNSIIAAGAVVSGIFTANVIIGGVPAKLIKHI